MARLDSPPAVYQLRGATVLQPPTRLSARVPATRADYTNGNGTFSGVFHGELHYSMTL